MIAGLTDLTSLNKDVARLNYDYLRLLREVAQKDKMIAQQRFGVSGLTAERIARLTITDLEELANCPNFLFTARSSSALDIMISTLLSPDVTTVQIDNVRLSSLLCDNVSPASRFREMA